MAAVGGMAGHGLRFLALEAGYRLQTATFLGGLAVGAVSAWMARSSRTPVAVISFAGAVTMMPGLHIYRALGGAVRLARQAEQPSPEAVAGTLGNAFQACLVVCALALGLLLGARAVQSAAEWASDGLSHFGRKRNRQRTPVRVGGPRDGEESLSESHGKAPEKER
jgi:uncharacterized membrane protein YjjB (DUF3815 family)